MYCRISHLYQKANNTNVYYLYYRRISNAKQLCRPMVLVELRSGNQSADQGPFLSLVRSNLGMCSANHREVYFSNLAYDWLSIVDITPSKRQKTGPERH